MKRKVFREININNNVYTLIHLQATLTSSAYFLHRPASFSSGVLNVFSVCIRTVICLPTWTQIKRIERMIKIKDFILQTFIYLKKNRFGLLLMPALILKLKEAERRSRKWVLPQTILNSKKWSTRQTRRDWSHFRKDHWCAVNPHVVLRVKSDPLFFLAREKNTLNYCFPIWNVMTFPMEPLHLQKWYLVVVYVFMRDVHH